MTYTVSQENLDRTIDRLAIFVLVLREYEQKGLDYDDVDCIKIRYQLASGVETIELLGFFPFDEPQLSSPAAGDRYEVIYDLIERQADLIENDPNYRCKL